MAQRRYHYERALESYLRTQRVPYIAVDEARKALLPEGAKLEYDEHGTKRSLKGFDFVVYGSGTNLLVEAKGRRLPRLRRKDGTPAKARLESWVTRGDIEALHAWTALFGEGYQAVFVFVYWCDDAPPDGLFTEVFEHGGRWYTLRALDLTTYEAHMVERSSKWGTVNLRSADFDRLWTRFVAPMERSGGSVLGLGTPESALDPYNERETRLLSPAHN